MDWTSSAYNATLYIVSNFYDSNYGKKQFNETYSDPCMMSKCITSHSNAIWKIDCINLINLLFLNYKEFILNKPKHLK